MRQVKRYTSQTVDCVTVYDASVDRCFYVPADELGSGMNVLTLRIAAARNNQRRKIRMADDYTHPPFPPPAAESLP